MELFGHRFHTYAYTVYIYIYILLYVYALFRKVQKQKKHKAHKASLEDLEDLCPHLSPSVLAPPRKADALAMGEDASGLVLKGLRWGSLAWWSCSKTERVGWQSSSSCWALQKYFKVQIHGSYCWYRWKNLQPSWETHTLVVKPVYDMYIDIHISNSCSTHPASTRQRSPGFECHTMVSNSGCRVSGLRSWSHRKSAEHEGTPRHIPAIGVIGRVYV